MLNLKELDAKFEKALANETDESLTQWLRDKRVKNALKALGKGNYTNIKTEFITLTAKENVSHTKPVSSNNSNSSEVILVENFKLAA